MQGFAGDKRSCSEGTAWFCSGDERRASSSRRETAESGGFLRVLDANPVVTQLDLHLELIQHMDVVSQFRQQQGKAAKEFHFPLPSFPSHEDEQNV